MIGDDHTIASVRDRLTERYLGFGCAGLHFEVRDISAEIAEARRRLVEFLGREPSLPQRPSRLIHLWVVTDDTHEIVGSAAREVGQRGAALVVAHKRLQIRRPWRGRGFGSALLSVNRDWYRECGVAFIVLEAEGDGSAFAATRGFDFDVMAYANRPGLAGLDERELRFAAVERLIRHPMISDTADGVEPQTRESVGAFLARLAALGGESARQVHRFRRRLPQSLDPGQDTLTGDAHTFTAPHEIAAFGEEAPLEVLGGASLGPAVLARTGWSAITAL